MKFTCSININKPIDNVVALFQDPESLKYSQKGFIRIDHIKGREGEAGAESKLIYKKFDLHETIIYNKLPKEFYAKYEHKHMINTMLTKFKAINDNETKLICKIEYIKFRGFIINFIAKVFPGMFKKQVEKWLDKFKYYVESQ